MPKVSVFTPTYNRASYLPTAFKSLQASTWKDFEWVIADDGSTDDTQQVVGCFRQTADFEIRYFLYPHQGKMRTMNDGVQQCQGEFFIELDSDDELSSTVMERALAVLQTIPHPEEYSGVVGLFEYTDGRPVHFFPEGINQMDEKRRQQIVRSGHRACIALIKTAIMKQYPFPIPEDLSFIPESTAWRKMDLKYKQWYTNEIFGIYHINEDPNSFTASKQDPRPAFFYYNYLLNEIYPYDRFVTPKEYGITTARLSLAAARCGLPLGRTLSELRPAKARLFCLLSWIPMRIYSDYQKYISNMWQD